VPARVLATVMILQAHEGLSDPEACDRLERDLAWQAAAGVHTGYEAFHSTVLVDQRNRLRASARPRRLFEDTKAAATEAGVMGKRVRVLDSTPIYDSLATQDTVTQLPSTIRKLLRCLDRDHPELAAGVRAALRRDDDYAGPGKPVCDWDDAEAREALVDALVRDARATSSAWPPPTRRSYWPWWRARTWTRATTRCSASRIGWRLTASSPPWTPRPAT